jgi:hypothetical protein
VAAGAGRAVGPLAFDPGGLFSSIASVTHIRYQDHAMLVMFAKPLVIFLIAHSLAIAVALLLVGA